MFAVALFLWATSISLFALPTSEYATQVSAQIQTSPPSITLGWPANPHAVDFKIYRKLIGDISWGGPIATLPTSATTYTDTNVTVGSAFEYQVEALTDYYPYPNGNSSDWLTAYGYCYAGIDAPLIESRGKVILIVDNAFSASLSNELARLQQDLLGDGWRVIRHDVGRTNSVGSVRALIQADYNADPANVRSVFLFGHIPVPYSGAINPDGHSDHYGAWPADGYYGELNGPWTDNSVNVTSAESSRNDNVPGDGKFDQSTIPSDVDLEVGRVDMFNLPAFAPKSELDLLRQYLNKDHAFRIGSFNLQRRSLLRDNFGDLSGEAPASTAWRNFSGLCGSNTITEVASDQFFPSLASGSYLWSYGCGGGSYNKADGVGDTGDFATSDPRSVFMMLFGSYFGDWDTQDNFLRAPLGTPTYTLTCIWGGYPVWVVHHMALGQTIGYSTRVSQNNAAGGLYRSKLNPSPRSVHVALMGDPTLRMHSVIPPSNLVNTQPGMAIVSWTASPDSVLGYHVYRSANLDGPFTRLTSSPISSTSFFDQTAPWGNCAYMVRAVKRETSGSGTYLNLSLGISTTINVTQGNTSCTPGPLNLAGWWPADGNAFDIQSTNHGVISSAVGYTAGKVSAAFKFDGTNDTVTIGPKFATITNNFTMAFWINPTRARPASSETNNGTAGLTPQRYAVHPTHGGLYGLGHVGWGISVGTNGVSVFEYCDSHGCSLLVMATPISNWTHVAVVCTNRSPRLYLNGNLVRTGLTSTYITHPSADLSGSLGHFAGALDEYQVYRRALSGPEIQALANTGAGGLCKQIQITGVSQTTANETELIIQGRTGKIGIEATGNFTTWSEIGVVTNSAGVVTFTDNYVGSQGRRFYRAQLRQ